MTITIKSHWSTGNKFYTAYEDDSQVGRMFLKRASKIKDIDLSYYGATGFPLNKIYYIDYIRVDRRRRRAGIATKLLVECKRWADISRNILILDALPLDETITQAALISFYKRNGFTVPVCANAEHSGLTYQTRDNKNNGSRTSSRNRTKRV